LKKGSKSKVAPELAKKLISEGIAKVSQHTDDFEKFIQKKCIENAANAIEDLPQGAKELVSHIKTMTNKDVLEELTQDKRKTVREEAFTRLEDIS